MRQWPNGLGNGVKHRYFQVQILLPLPTAFDKRQGSPLCLLNRIWDCVMTKIDIENGSRRFGMDRRLFSYAIHIPERRSSNDRRNGFGRRSGLDRRNPQEFRSLIGMDRKRSFRNI
jgi:hypothetical protein